MGLGRWRIARGAKVARAIAAGEPTVLDFVTLLFQLAIIVFCLGLFFIFPYANEKRCERFPLGTALLIGANVAAFAWQVWLSGEGLEASLETLGYRPDRSGWPNLLIFNFAHAGFFHLAFNMWYLQLVGGQVEERLGTLWFLIFYLCGGLAAALGHKVFYQFGGDARLVAGASGCVYAVLGAYFVLYPFEDFRYFYSFFFHIGTIRIATLFVVTYKVLGDIIMARLQLLDSDVSAVAHWAHLGGFAFGIAVALLVFGPGAFIGRPQRRLVRGRWRTRNLTRPPGLGHHGDWPDK